MYRLRSKTAVIFLALVLIGCAARPLHPGSVNRFDSDAYDLLLVTDSVIQTTRADIQNGVFSPGLVNNIRNALNGLITAYNAADIAYKEYHSAALAGTATAAQQAAVTNTLTQVQVATTTFINAKAGK
jgi:hypothetical protein